MERDDRKVLEGVVLSDKMDKTRVVTVERRLRHKSYGKVLTRTTKLYAHDEKNESKAGDHVAVMETRPLSKLKRWRLVSVIKRAQEGKSVEEALGGTP
ncbi:MAG: 30S ribosomal protein S17 [Elusimicrobia bacterium]|jgi:small subunit ribosomal protein S17|nr:30S ribosomal protein S17 [Elusimicrobiota bacterium]